MSPEHTEFNRLMALLDYPLFIVTTTVDEERAGCLIGFASQVSIRPPRFLACLSVKNRTYRVATRASVLVVHAVPADAGELAELFGGETGDEVDKFARCPWRPGPEGVPVLSELDDWFAGRILSRYDLGDHCGFLLEPIDGQAPRATSQFTFRRARWIEPGHEP